MLDPEKLYLQFAQKPFQPVRVYVKGGRVVDILSRRTAVIGRTFIDVGVQAPNEPEGICAEIIHIPLTDVEKIEPVQVTTASP